MNRQPREPWEIELDAEIKRAKANPICICGGRKPKGTMLCPTCDNEAEFLFKEFIAEEWTVLGTGCSPIKLNTPPEKSDTPIKTIKTDAPIKQTQPINDAATHDLRKALISVLEHVELLSASNDRVIDALMELGDALNEQHNIIIALEVANNGVSRSIYANFLALTKEQQDEAWDSLGVTRPLANRFRAGNANMRKWIKQYINSLHSKGDASSPVTRSRIP